MSLLKKYSTKKSKLFEFNSKGNAYYRINPEYKNLKEEDYRFGFGIDSTHYFKVKEEREKVGLKTSENYLNSWDSREGFNIEGNPLKTAYHPLHDTKIINKKGEVYIIDAVHEHFYFGKYLVLLIRKEGTKSHGVIFWENMGCKDPIVIEGIEKTHDEFKIHKEK